MNYLRLSIFLAVSTSLVVVGCAQRTGTATVVDQDGRPVADMPVVCIPSVAVTRLSFASGPASIAGPLPFRTSYDERDRIQLSTGAEGSVTWTGRADQIRWHLGRRPGFLPISGAAWTTQGVAPRFSSPNPDDENFHVWRLADPASMPVLTTLEAEGELLPLPAWTALRWTARITPQPLALVIRCTHHDGAWTIQLRSHPGLLPLDAQHLDAVPEKGYHDELLLRSPPIPSGRVTLQLPLLVSRTDLVHAPFTVFSALKIEIESSPTYQRARIKARTDVTGGRCLLEPSLEWSLRDRVNYDDPIYASPRPEVQSEEIPLPIDGWRDLTQEIAHTADGWTIHALRP